MIKIENLTYKYNTKKVLDNINLDIDSSTHIIGDSGSGKSTLLRTLNGLIPHFYGGKLQGKVEINQKNTQRYKINELAKEVGLLFQDPENQFLTSTVNSEIVLGMENLGFKKEEIKQKLDYFTDKLYLANLLDRKTDQLSGGEKQKVILASILSMDPKILALDEPFSEIDQKSKDNLNEILTNLEDEHTILIAEHSQKINSEKIYLNGGKISTYIPKKIEFPKINSKKGDILLDIDNLSCGYNKKEIISNLDLDLYQGECLTLCGENGSGKSTLIKAMLNMIKSVGKINFYKNNIGVVFQDLNLNFMTDSVENEIIDSTKNLNIIPKIDELTDYFNLKKGAYPQKMSGGQMQRLALACAFARKSEILILDEPTRGMDQNNKLKLFNLIKKHCENQKAAIIATHDRDIINFSTRRRDLN